MGLECEVGGNVLHFPRAPTSPAEFRDLRFRTLLGEKAWAQLPPAVRTRFGRHIGTCQAAVYTGEIVECRMSRAGWLLSQICRLIGAPLPVSTDICVPAIVAVTEDPQGRGQFWTRSYGRLSGFPQVIHSVKRFAGRTGLEEYVGCGIGIALTICVKDGALHFDSDHYFLKLGRYRLPIPRWMAPGRLRVSHIDCGHDSFAFVLQLRHPLGGELVRQTVMFKDVEPAP